MTENEALFRIKDLEYECMNSTIHYFTDKDIPMLQMAIQSLEEIQQYRELGTVEHIKLTFELCKGLDAMVKMYQAIGTIEEFKVLKEKEERFDRNIKMFNEIGLEVRNKAIDEFAEKLIKHISQMPSGYIGSGNVLIIAEQMKAGGIDG